MNKNKYHETVTGQILKAHLVEGVLEAGKEISLRVDQTLTQDTTGTMAYLQAEALGIEKAQTEISVSYIDHNVVGEDFRDVQDHAYLQSMANHLGVYFSKAGNGICHQVHLERFAKPGKTLLGSDSHTPTAGGLGTLAMGAGGLDVILALSGKPYTLIAPEIIGIKLTGKLSPMVAAKDIILEVLRRLTVQGGRGKILEYFGEGVLSLTVPQRSTIANMGAETGATTSIFPSDEQTRDFLKKLDRESDYQEIQTSSEEGYSEILEIDLSKLEPLIAKPFSPDNVDLVKNCEGKKVGQVFIGSCTNSSYEDLVLAAKLLEEKKIPSHVSVTISPGSMSIYNALAESGHLEMLENSGAKVQESSCASCLGFGYDSKIQGVSIKTFNRNFHGHFMNKTEEVYLSSVQTAIACALAGKIEDPRKLGMITEPPLPERLKMREALIIIPEKSETHERIKNPNLSFLSPKEELPETLEGLTLLKLGDNVTTEEIAPTGKLLPLRNDIPEYLKHTFEIFDQDFYNKAMQEKGGFIIAGENYGQGSSREHAALCPSLLGIKVIIAKTFARIHQANLINFGVVPLVFKRAEDYDKILKGEKLRLKISKFEEEYELLNLKTGERFKVEHNLTPKNFETLKAGGLLAKIRKENRKSDECCIKT